MRNLVIALTLFLATGMSAQTCYYINSLAVQPANPTTTGPVSILVSGDLSSGGAYITQASAVINGFEIDLTVSCTDPGGIGVLVPFDTLVPLGTLPAGSYHINLMGMGSNDGVSDTTQYYFQVSGATGVEEIIVPFQLAHEQNGLAIHAGEGELQHASIMDLKGSLVGSYAPNVNRSRIVVDHRAITPGLYLLVVNTTEGVFTEKVLVPLLK